MSAKSKKKNESNPLPAGFLVDLANNNILYANPLTPQYGLPVLTELKRCTFNSTLRVVGNTSPIAKLGNVGYIKSNHLQWKEDRWSAEISFEPTTEDIDQFKEKKELTASRAGAIRSVLFFGFLILGEYAVGYGNIDYEASVGYALDDNVLLADYAGVHNLTVDQARSELEFDYRERQVKKFKIYAYQQKFFKDLREAATVAEVNKIKEDIQKHFWKNGFI